MADNFGRMAGRRYAADEIRSMTAHLKGYMPIEPVLAQLELGCANKPPAEAQGIREVIQLVRQANAAA